MSFITNEHQTRAGSASPVSSEVVQVPHIRPACHIVMLNNQSVPITNRLSRMNSMYLFRYGPFPRLEFSLFNMDNMYDILKTQVARARCSDKRAPLLQNQHRIAITIEPILMVYRMAIRLSRQRLTS